MANQHDNVEARLRVERVVEARTHVSAATAQLEAALGSLLASGIKNPAIEDVREAILIGKKCTAKLTELARWLP